MADEIEIHRRIIADMQEGVITLDLEGHITTFNRAAGQLLGIDPEGAKGLTFAEVFFAENLSDEFNDLVLRAIYDNDDDEEVDSAEIHVNVGGEHRNLLVSTTLLRDGEESGARKIGVIVVFSDISERYKRKKLKKLFNRYVDPRIVELILSGGTDQRAQRGAMSVLFCDLQGFTSMSEHLAPEQVIDLVNLYLGQMSTPVLDQLGIIDKYIGDAIMAFWGAPFHTDGDHARRACAAALNQRARLDELRAALKATLGLDDERLARIDIRVGIATGDVVAGNVGTEIATNYTVLGDTVNVAARLEAANKQHGTRILVNEATARAVAGDFELREVDLMSLHGRAKQERVYELLAAKSSS